MSNFPYLTLDFHQICVQCVFWRDLIVLEEIFNFWPPLKFWEIFQISKFWVKIALSIHGSLFDAGCPRNFYPMCILMWSNCSRTSGGPLGTSSGNQGSSVLPPLDQMRSACVMSFHLIPCWIQDLRLLNPCYGCDTLFLLPAKDLFWYHDFLHFLWDFLACCLLCRQVVATVLLKCRIK